MIERKRHIGNDAVVVFFRSFEGCSQEEFDPSNMMTSQFIKIFILLDVLDTKDDDVQLSIRVFTR